MLTHKRPRHREETGTRSVIGAWLRRLLGGRKGAQFNFDWITPDWAVGAAPEATQLADLARTGLGSVLDLRREAQPNSAEFARHGLHLLHVPIADRSAPSQEQLLEATGWLLAEVAAGRRTLICCHAGAGRSVTVACAVLLQIGFPLSQTLPLIAKHRRAANPTEQQIAALCVFASRRAPPDTERVGGALE